MMSDIVAKDLPEFHSLLSSLKTHVNDSCSHVSSITDEISHGNNSREDGLSFIEMKCHLFLEYLIDLTYSMILKINGRGLVGDPCVERLVEIRTVLEKIRPIDKKLRYQVDKLIKIATTDLNKDDQHPLSFKPNLDDLVGKEEEEGDGSEESEVDQVYVPPKVMAVPYEDDNKKSLKEKKLEKARQKSLNSALLEDLRHEYGDGPEEIRDSFVVNKRAKMKQKEDERERFEEDNLRRLMVTKKDKIRKRQLNDFDEIVKMGKFQSLDDDESSGEETYSAKKKKGKGKFGGQNKKFNKRMQRRKK